MFRAGLLFVLLCLFTESRPHQGTTRGSPLRNAEQNPGYRATQRSGQQGGSVGHIPNVKNEQSRGEITQKLFTCDICSEEIKPPYKFCRNGHLLCDSCWPKLERLSVNEMRICPTCRVPIPPKPSRCLALETLSNFIDPDMSPTVVITPDDPMDSSSRLSSPQLHQTQGAWDRKRSPDRTRRISPSNQRPVLFESPRTTPSTRTERGTVKSGSRYPLAKSPPGQQGTLHSQRRSIPPWAGGNSFSERLQSPPIERVWSFLT